MVATGRKHDLIHLAKPKDQSSTVAPNDDFDRWTLNIPLRHFRALLQKNADIEMTAIIPFDEDALRKFLRTCLLRMRRGQTTFNLRFLVVEDFDRTRDARKNLLQAASGWGADAKFNYFPVAVTFVVPNAQNHAPLNEGAIRGNVRVATDGALKWNEIFESPTAEEMVIPIVEPVDRKA